MYRDPLAGPIVLSNMTGTRILNVSSENSTLRSFSDVTTKAEANMLISVARCYPSDGKK